MKAKYIHNPKQSFTAPFKMEYIRYKFQKDTNKPKCLGKKNDGKI